MNEELQPRRDYEEPEENFLPEEAHYVTDAPVATVDFLEQQSAWQAVQHASVRDLKLARAAKKSGAQDSLRIIWEARRAGVPISAAFALFEKESGFRNVYGHDSVRNRAPKGGKVTKSNYQNIYLRDRRAGMGMQGVGPGQLTWFAFQDRADRLGGAWVKRHNIRVSLEVLGSHYKKYRRAGHSTRKALQFAGRDYNGAGGAAEAYGRDFIVRFDKWHKRLT